MLQPSDSEVAEVDSRYYVGPPSYRESNVPRRQEGHDPLTPNPLSHSPESSLGIGYELLQGTFNECIVPD
jgi:hypothetical protein